ncbi:MAG: AraC family transcriptional regulator [Cellvibrionaceae bacterium]|nr:AraC family transcriptional regulator [Cellvibrionaceae bacterium]|tara:strand:- start:21012 stop:22082 length:1071 start_codon:yes stop_codon:yes gene_type:complete
MDVTVNPATPSEENLADHSSASVAALRQYLEMAKRLELDTDAILAPLNFPSDLLTDNTRRVSLAQFEQAVSRLISASGDALFGLHTSEHIEPAFYSVQGYISLNCATLKEAMTMIPLYEKIVGDMGVSDFSYKDDLTLLRWKSQLDNSLVKRHVRENIISSWFRFTQNFLKVSEKPEAVWFEHAAPTDATALQQYQDLFQCPVEFSRPYTGLWISNENLNIRIQQADEKLLRVLLEHATQQLNEIEKGLTLSEQIKGMLRLMLNQQIPSSELIADKLGISVRTLQRKLNDEGTSYKEVLNELRQELAMHYVKNSTLNFDVIATKLGFSEPRSFYRSFKKWTGSTAKQYRQAAIAEH